MIYELWINSDKIWIHLFFVFPLHQQFEIAEAMKLQSDLWHVETTTHPDGRRDKVRKNKKSIILKVALKEAT